MSPLKFQIIIITQTLVRSDCAVCVNMSPHPTLGLAQNPSNSQKQHRAECGTLWVSAVRTVFITILDSVKSVIIRSQCHRRNETDIHTELQRNVCMYCDEFDWHIYVSRRGGRDIMWTLNNVITNCHSSGIAMTFWPIRSKDLENLSNGIEDKKSKTLLKGTFYFWFLVKAKCLDVTVPDVIMSCSLPHVTRMSYFVNL